MTPHDLSLLVPWVISHGYLIFWLAATIEGPLTTIAGGVAAALGYFNIYIIMALALAGDLAGDIIYYGIGYSSHGLLRSPFFRRLGLNERRISKIETLLHTHTRRAILLVKLSPVIGPIGLMVIGAARPKFKKFISTALILAIPKSLFFVWLGFYSGQTYLELNKVIAQGQYIILGIAVFIALIYLLYVKILSLLTKKLED